MKTTFTLAALLAAFFISGCGESADQPATIQTPQTDAPLAIMVQDAALQWGGCPDIFPTGCQIAILHGDPAQPNVDVFLRVPGGYEIPAHSHTSAERMILVAGELNVQYQGAPATTLTLGEYAYGPAGLPHRATCVSADACTLFIAFVGPVDAAAFAGSLE